MPERAEIAVILSILVHAALIGGAALMPVREAAGESRVGVDADAHVEGGFHGNTFDIDGFVEGELGGGKRGPAEAQASPEETPPAETPPAKTPPAEAPAAKAPVPATPTGEAKPATSAPDPPKAEKKKGRRKRKGEQRRRRRRARGEQGEAKGDRAGAGDGQTGEAKDGERGRRHGTDQAPPGQLTAPGAFTHALALAYSASSFWHELPMGEAGVAEVSLTVDRGKVTKTTLSEGAPALLEKLATGAAAMTKLRRIDGDGVAKLRLHVSLAQVSVPELKKGDGKLVLKASDHAPTASEPGRITFLFASGRQVTIVVEIL